MRTKPNDADHQLYEVVISTSATVYVLAEDEDEAREVAASSGGEELIVSEVEVDSIDEINEIKEVPDRVLNDVPYGSDLTIKHWFLARDERASEEMIVTQAELEEIGQLRLL